MKIGTLLAGLIVLLALALPAWAQTAAAPKIVIAKVEHSIGEIRKGQPATYAFVFRNEGKDDLEIKNVAPSCGCTASEYTRFVPPGQEGRIQLTVNTSSYSGAVTKTAEVYTNDPAKDHFTLMLNMVILENGTELPKGRQVGPFLVGPHDTWSGRTPQGLSTTGLISITNLTQDPIKLGQIQTAGSAFAVSLQTLEEGKRYGLSFVTAPDLPLGVHRQAVKLPTGNAQLPLLELTLEVTVYPAVSFTPASLIFESVPASNPDFEPSLVSKFLWVRLGRGAGLEVTSATSDLPFVKVKEESRENGGQAIILRVSLGEKPPKGTHKGTIRIQTNNPTMKAFEVPITFNVN